MLPKIACRFVIVGVLLLLASPDTSGQNRGPSAQSIVARMGKVYGGVASYQDAGVVEEFSGKTTAKRRKVISFETYFARPQFFRFEWMDFHFSPESTGKNILWCDGKQTYSLYTFEPEVEVREDLSMGIAGATGISRSSAHTVPRLLSEAVSGFTLTELKRLSLVGQEQFEGEACYVVRGYHPFGQAWDMWITKRDFLLRKLKTPNEDGSFAEEIHRNIKVNLKIPPEIFNYRPAPTKRF